MSVRRPWVANGLLLLASTAMVWLGAEIVLRAVHWTPLRYRVRVRLSSRGDVRLRSNSVVLDCYPNQVAQSFPVDLNRPEVLEHYRALGITDFSAALPDSPWCIEFRYNSLGVRGPEFGPKRAGVKRIVAVGDSFTEGQGVPEGDTYPSLLASRLESAVPGRYEVLNFGQRATDFPELLDLFERALQLSPDLVIYGLCLNDAERSAEYDRRWPRLNDWVMVRRPPIDLEWWNSRLGSFVADRIEQWRIARDTTEWYRGMYGPPNRDGWERTRNDFRRMKDEAESRQARLMVAVWPLLVGLEGRYPFREVHERLAASFERQKIPHQDLLDVLSGQESASLWAHPADRHPNRRANALAAGSMLAMVRSLIDSPGVAAPN